MIICGWIGALLITVVIVAIVERISKTNLPYGWVGNIVAGFIGGVVGQLLLGQFGPFLFGVYLIPTFVGSFIFIMGAKLLLGQLAKMRR